jgi:hypothetical protein
MNHDRKSLLDCVIDWFEMLGQGLRVATNLPTVDAIDESGTGESDQAIDPDFEGWLHGNPSVTNNPASRYGDRKPGYITGNGLASMEIGAADD